MLNETFVKFLCTLSVVTVAFTPFSCAASISSAEQNDMTLSTCFKPPETVVIECRVINVKNASCIDKNVISIPSIPENDEHGEINCTSASHPITLSFNGYMLNDYVNTSFVRNADNVFNEATYVFSVSFKLLSIKAPREVTVGLENDPEHKTTFFLYRPAHDIFSSNLKPKLPETDSVLLVEHKEKDLTIPCIPNDPSIKPSLTGPQNSSSFNITFLETRGFLIKSDENHGDPSGRYVCEASRKNSLEKERITFEVQPKKDAIFQPQTDDVYLFGNSPLKISCQYGKRVILEGSFKNKPISPKPIVSDTNILPFESKYVDNYAKVGDNGSIQCKSLEEDGAILKSWNVKTLDITNNSVLEMKKLQENRTFVTLVCQSSSFSLEQMKLQVVLCQGETECKLNEFCFDEKTPSSSCVHTLATPCNPTNGGSSGGNKRNSLCMTLRKNDTNLSQGMIRCTAGNHSYQTNFFIGFDKTLYLDWEEAPLSALIDISVPNVTMYPQNSYPFGCKSAKFISDGRLQWVIRGKDGSEILLHKNRVQDLYGVHATNIDYELYTVRESNIKLIYPNDYDVICMVPMWNATAWVRHHKRINVAAKEAPVVEIVSASVSVIVILLILIAFVMWRLKKAKDAIRNLTEKEVQEFLEGNPEALKNSIDKDAHEVVDSLPYDKKYEIPREKLLIDTENVLGKGAFGTVLKGRVEGLKDTVAVKTVNSSCEVNRFKGFLSELKIMIFIGKHPNIVSLIGASTEKIKEKTLYIVVEYCPNGSLESYLRKHQSFFIDQVVNDDIQLEVATYENTASISTSTFSTSLDGPLATVDLIRFSYQIAHGMEYLASKKVVHADLAARNVLVSNGNVKITDFGLSRQLFDYAQYVKKQQEPLPWRWMAIESLQQLRFSSQTDVWAYGVLLWEIFSLGNLPYAGLSWEITFVQQLCNGLRLTKPLHSTSKMYTVMVDCWHEAPEDRPNFTFLAQYFKSLLEILNVELEVFVESQPNQNAYSNINDLIPGYLRIADLSDRKSTNVYTNS